MSKLITVTFKTRTATEQALRQLEAVGSAFAGDRHGALVYHGE